TLKMARRDADELQQEIARLDAEATAASQQCAALRNLAENCERYLRDAGAIAFHTGTVSLNRGDTLESIRKEIATLKADRHEIESQCLDAKTATAIAFREID